MGLQPTHLGQVTHQAIAHELRSQVATLEQLAARADYLVSFSEMLSAAIRTEAIEIQQFADRIGPPEG